MAEQDLICIGCPMGCALQVTVRDGKMQKVRGNLCRRGQTYARDETEDPRRMVTSLIRLSHCEEPLSVRTEKAIPKAKIFACLRAIRQADVTLPVTVGDVVIENVLQTGIDVIATKSLPRESRD